MSRGRQVDALEECACTSADSNRYRVLGRMRVELGATQGTTCGHRRSSK